MPKGPLYDSHIAALLVHALNINKIVELDLVIDSFWFSPTIAAKYLSELAADNYLSYKQ